MSREPVQQAVARALTDQRLRIVAGLAKATGDLDLAEDCLQDAVERALTRWPEDGVPDNPAAWLTVTAHRRALDVLRRRSVEATKLREVQMMAEREPDAPTATEQLGDDRLALLFTCCHPALPLAGRVALTLKTVAGLSTREVARAFLVSEATMSQRLLRTKQKIVNAGIAFRVPAPHRLAERTSGVLAVVYLLFNEGYAATQGDTLRPDISAEAIALAALVSRLLPDDDEAAALHALLLLQHSRRHARTRADGELVPMEQQDRGLWDAACIRDGIDALARARASGRPPGVYRAQAEIAALHATAPSAEATDWAVIVVWYDALLAAQKGHAVVALNRAVAISYRDGPDAGVAALDDIDLPGYYLLPAARADMLRRLGRLDESAQAYREALALVRTEPERRFLLGRLAAVADR